MPHSFLLVIGREQGAWTALVVAQGSRYARACAHNPPRLGAVPKISRLIVAAAQMLDDKKQQRFPTSTPDQPLPRVVAIAPHLVPVTATMNEFRELNLRLAQVCMNVA